MNFMHKKQVISGVGIGLLVVGLSLVGWLGWAVQAVDGQATHVQTFVIPKGQALQVIGQRLREEKLIRSPLLFRLWVKRQGLEQKIPAGSFKISPNLSLNEVIQLLVAGTDDVWVTLLEGWRKEEVAASLAKQLKNFDSQEFLTLASESEGYLFPDTYLFPQEATAKLVYDTLLSTFERKISSQLRDEIESQGKTLAEVIILASIIEREAQQPADMKLVAGVLQNRLNFGMPLQVDATLQYAKGYNQVHQSWWVEPRAADKQLNSLFNTYKYPGLPPGPICNPGLNAITAAIYPTQSDYLYYISDRSGKMHYAVDLEEHNANVQKYLR